MVWQYYDTIKAYCCQRAEPQEAPQLSEKEAKRLAKKEKKESRGKFRVVR